MESPYDIIKHQFSRWIFLEFPIKIPIKFQSSPFFLAGPGALRIPRCSAVAIEVPCRMRLAERLWHLGDRSTTRGRRWGRHVCREKRCQNMMKRTSNGGKPWENLGKMLGKPQENAGNTRGICWWEPWWNRMDFHDKTIWNVANITNMWIPWVCFDFFAKASKPTGDSPQVPRLLVSHMFPAVAVQRAQWFRKSDYSGKNAW